MLRSTKLVRLTSPSPVLNAVLHSVSNLANFLDWTLAAALNCFTHSLQVSWYLVSNCVKNVLDARHLTGSQWLKSSICFFSTLVKAPMVDFAFSLIGWLVKFRHLAITPLSPKLIQACSHWRATCVPFNYSYWTEIPGSRPALHCHLSSVLFA